MTLSTTTNKVVYIGNGIATTFAIPFPFLEKEHLKVRQLLNNVQTERSDWTVSGGNLVFATAPAANATTSMLNAQIWAEGTDEQVEALGGIYSAKEWAEQSTNTNIDLSNLSEIGEAHFSNPALTNTSYMASRLLKLPKSFNLELNNGVLTLKAGSKLYDGTGIFTTISSDINRTETTNGTFVLLYGNSNQSIWFFAQNHVKSGVTPLTNGVLFNTSDGHVYIYENGNAVSTASFPIAIVTVTNGAISSIDSLFNWCGYIGTTLFVLPGVQVSYADGLNEDGTYKTVIETSDSVVYADTAGWGNSSPGVVMFSASGDMPNNHKLQYQPISRFDPESSDYMWKFENGKTWWKNGNTGNWEAHRWVFIADASCGGGSVKNWKPFEVDAVANSNATNFSAVGKSFLSGLGTPGLKHESWTAGASGTNYKCPANGWVYAAGNWASTGSGFKLEINVSAKGYGTMANTGAAGPSTGKTLCPVEKGDVVTLSYTAITITALKFIYNNGEK